MKFPSLHTNANTYKSRNIAAHQNTLVKKVVLITTGQPATNPRLVKEADSLAAAGFDVTVLYCYFIQWAMVFENEMLPAVSWKHSLVGGSPESNQFLYAYTRMRFKLSRLVNRYIHPSLLAERAQARAFDELLKAAKSVKADLYIGHNLGALAVAVKAAEQHNAKASFDFEDYHRGEFESGDRNRSRIEILEERYVHKLAYYSSSSPLIAEALQTDHPLFQGATITLLNCFPHKQRTFVQPKIKSDNTLKLFWFSQTIGKNRGLETIVDALKQLNDPAIQLTLVGRCDTGMQEWLAMNTAALKSKILFAGLIPPSELPAIASHHDIGLATEISTPVNRGLCLTNKLFTYVMAGNCIVASDTAAQKDFMSQHNDIGLLYKVNDSVDLARQLLHLKRNRDLLRTYKRNAWRLFATLNWENESEKLQNVLSSMLQENLLVNSGAG